MFRKKSLLIGINYTGTSHQLQGCHQDVRNVAEFLSYRGYSNDPHSQVILRDDLGGPYYPTGHNILVRDIRQPDVLSRSSHVLTAHRQLWTGWLASLVPATSCTILAMVVR